MTTKHFLLEEANSYVPWLNLQFQCVEEVQERIAQRQEQLAELTRKGHRNGSTGVEQEVVSLRKELEDQMREVRQLLGEITTKGIIVRDVAHGLVDFPHRRAGREVYLCWVRQEVAIQFWHETNVGFADRQPL